MRGWHYGFPCESGGFGPHTPQALACSWLSPCARRVKDWGHTAGPGDNLTAWPRIRPRAAVPPPAERDERANCPNCCSLISPCCSLHSVAWCVGHETSPIRRGVEHWPRHRGYTQGKRGRRVTEPSLTTCSRVELPAAPHVVQPKLPTCSLCNTTLTMRRLLCARDSLRERPTSCRKLQPNGGRPKGLFERHDAVLNRPRTCGSPLSEYHKCITSAPEAAARRRGRPRVKRPPKSATTAWVRCRLKRRTLS